jgi:flotillin
MESTHLERARSARPPVRRSNSGAGAGVMMVLLALALMVGPFFAPFLDGGAMLVLMAFGTVLMFLGLVIITITRLYVKTSSDEAIVRTGMGGPKVVIDGGTIVIPVVHELTPVSLKTMRLDVERAGQDALITGNNLRADVKAEFYIRVQKNQEDILTAATSLGEKCSNPRELTSLVFEKLVNALRTVAGRMPLADLHTKRDDFAGQVQEIVAKELQANGLTLESVTISRLDQTSTRDLRPDENVFDAQGARTIAEITSRARVERNQLERRAEMEVSEQDVQSAEFLASQSVKQARVEAERDRDSEMARAEAAARAAAFRAEQERRAGLAEVDKEREIALAAVEREKQLEVANAQREQAVKAAEVEREKTVELADRQKQVAIAEQETRVAQAAAQRAAAEAERTEKEQEVRTVEVTATAEREKRRRVIEAQAEAEQEKARQNAQADVEAYAITARATAEQAAAENRAAAQIRAAEAGRQARVLEAEGEQAIQMVPVEVEKEGVEVERARVGVERERLSQQAEFEKVAIEKELALAGITAEKEFRVAFANAMATAYGKANITIWGDPSTMAKMAQAFASGQANGQFLTGLAESLPDGSRTAAENLFAGFGNFLAGFRGESKLTPERLEKFIHEHPDVLERVLGNLKIVGQPGAGADGSTPD